MEIQKQPVSEFDKLRKCKTNLANFAIPPSGFATSPLYGWGMAFSKNPEIHNLLKLMIYLQNQLQWHILCSLGGYGRAQQPGHSAPK